jgi:hypothetical protein
MSKEIKIGDLVETCSLMPGVVMKINGRDIEARMLDIDEYKTNDYACCSLDHCGIIKLTAEQAKQRLILGKEKLTEIWRREGEWETFEDYQKLIEEALKS